MDPFKTKEFKKLQKQWYKKLEKSGFEDIEEFDSPKELLKRTSTNNSKYVFTPENKLKNDVKQDYYRLAGFFLHDNNFESKSDKLIWSWHSEGKSMRWISSELRKHSISKATTQVKETIHRLKAQMIQMYQEHYYNE